MAKRSETRRGWWMGVGLALVASFCIGVACGDLEGVLLDEECFDNSDCGSLTCARAAGVVLGTQLNSAGLGWCSETAGSCEVGAQPYCACGDDPASSDPLCTSPGGGWRSVTSTRACWDGADLGTCICIPPAVDCPYDAEDG